MNQRQKGVAIIEFALILPFLLLLSITAVELGRAIWHYNTLTKSVRDAARYLSTKTPGTMIEEARTLMVYGDVRDRTKPTLAIGLSLENVPAPSPDDKGCCSWQTAGTAPVINTVTVRIIGYQFRPMFSSVFGVALPTMTYPPISATMRSYL